MKNVKRTLSLVLVGALLFGAGYKTKIAKADDINNNRPQEIQITPENTKSENPNIEYHWCTFWTDADDNCIENGYYYLMKDQNGEVYSFSKDYSYQDCSNMKKLVVTKYNKKNVIQAYEITPYGLVSEMKREYDGYTSPSHVGGAEQ